MVVVYALLETVPPDHSGADPDRRTAETSAEADTYEHARDKIFEQLAPGWRVVWLRR